MLLHIGVLPLFFAATLAAALPSPKQSKESLALSIKDNLCFKSTHSLNISEVCSTISETLVDSSASTLHFGSKTTCNHAVYLVQKLCDLTKSDKNVTKMIQANVTTILSSNNDNNWDKICQLMLKNGIELGFVNKSTINDTGYQARCTFECVSPVNNTFTLNPLCNFMLWSWTYIKNHPIGNETSSNVPSAPIDILEGHKTATSQVVLKPDNSRMVSQTQLGTPPPVDKPNSPQTSQGNSNVQIGQSTGSPGKADGAFAETVNENYAGSANEDPNLVKIVKAAEQTPTPVNRPSSPVKKEDSNDGAVQQGLDGLSKSPTHAKIDEDDLLAREDGNEDSHDNPDIEDQGVNNLEPLPHEKLQSDDKKDVQGVSKNSKNDFNLEAGDNGEGEDPDDEEELPPKRRKEPVAQRESHEKMSAVDEDNEAEDSHFFGLFFVATFVCIVFYLIYLNKRKIIAMALEGKKGRHSGRRRPTSASYQKLDNKLDEVMASSPPPSKTHVIY